MQPQQPQQPNNNNNNNNRPIPQQQQPQQPIFFQDGNAAWTTEETATIAMWRERERRQRSIRMLIMFLVMLVLMDEEPPDHMNNNNSRLRGNDKQNKALLKKRYNIDPNVFYNRRKQDELIHITTQNHHRYERLLQKNKGRNYEIEINDWAIQQSNLEKDEFEPIKSKDTKYGSRNNNNNNINNDDDIDNNKSDQSDPDYTTKVYHYPWNATGFYRGEWTLIKNNNENNNNNNKLFDEYIPPATILNNNDNNIESTTSMRKLLLPEDNNNNNNNNNNIDDNYNSSNNNNKHNNNNDIYLNAIQVEQYMIEYLKARKVPASVLALPDNIHIHMRDDNNLTTTNFDTMRIDGSGKLSKPENITTTENNNNKAIITLTRENGRAAFQLVSRSIACMREVSLVDGFVKLYDSTSPGYSTRQDVLMRVHGVLLHSIGKLSLISNVEYNRMIFAINNNNNNNADNNKKLARRRLKEALKTNNINQIRDNAIALYADSGHELIIDRNNKKTKSTRNREHNNEDDDNVFRNSKHHNNYNEENEYTTSAEEDGGRTQRSNDYTHSTTDPDNNTDGDGNNNNNNVWSNIVFPYPFIPDDKEETIRKARTLASRTMPPREQSLEANAAGCSFEIDMDVKDVEWTVGAWRKLIKRRVEEIKKLDPKNNINNRELDVDGNNNNKIDTGKGGGTRTTSFTSQGRRQLRKKTIQDQALIMNMVGTIHSPNCNFTAFINTTALRTDWDATTSKSINYSFYMMLVCLTQILILLRQLLHTQSQSTATRVSILCIGWQTIIDALLCLAHIYLSLAMQPLFTAFASVAFFKLLIFCVIEMKYMAIIIQARNSSNGGQPTDVLRRQVAMLHLRFYIALLAIFLLMFYISDKYRIYYTVALYSFWVPQIILNIITEARTPMHKYYIYGMSVTRLVFPLYIFGIRNNFLKEVYPESPTDIYMCQILILWVALQAIILIAQGKYGARFMIPARFLPPKFDYSRPIPPSMLPPGALDLPTPELMDERDNESTSQSIGRSKSDSSQQSRDVIHQTTATTTTAPVIRHQTAETTRNRLRGNRLNQQESGVTTMTAENHHHRSISTASVSAPTLECSICYDPIDIRDRKKYMLAPCNHLFHKDCLAQWMDVKMECPVCRTELPAL